MSQRFPKAFFGEGLGRRAQHPHRGSSRPTIFPLLCLDPQSGAGLVRLTGGYARTLWLSARKSVANSDDLYNRNLGSMKRLALLVALVAAGCERGPVMLANHKEALDDCDLRVTQQRGQMWATMGIVYGTRWPWIPFTESATETADKAVSEQPRSERAGLLVDAMTWTADYGPAMEICLRDRYPRIAPAWKARMDSVTVRLLARYDSVKRTGR